MKGKNNAVFDPEVNIKKKNINRYIMLETK